MKNEALNSFLQSIKTGNSIKDCIFTVQNEVLPKVPNERNKFFIKFTFDNQLQASSLTKSHANKGVDNSHFQIEIGVNKFRNGAAQLYHKIGVAPAPAPALKDPSPGRSGQCQPHFSIFHVVFPTEIQAESGDVGKVMKTRQRTVQELREIGTFPRRFLKKQLTNDRSAPFVSGRDERVRVLT